MDETGISIGKKKTVDTVKKFQDTLYGMNNGLWQDAHNNWTHIFTAGSVLSDPEEMESLPQSNKVFFEGKLYERMSPYGEYLDRVYDPDAVDAIQKAPGSDPEKIAQHDAIVDQFNTLLEQGGLTPEKALALYHEAMALFKK